MATSSPPRPVSPPSSLHGASTQLLPQSTHPPPTQTTAISHIRQSRPGTSTSASSTQGPQSSTATANGGAPPAVPRPSNNRKGSSGRSRTAFVRLRSAFSPSTHDLKEYDTLPPDTTRPYLHKQQRHRLQRKSWVEWLITLLLCLAYFLVLFLFQRDQAIDKQHRRIFNALVTGIVLLLGVNLNNSLRSYAKMIRWRFLAVRYRSIKEFDLIMGSDSVMSVLGLVYHGRRKHNKFPLNARVQFYALAWLLVQLGIVVCVGVIGLTYNLDISQTLVNTQTGNTSSIDLSSLSSNNYLYDLSATQAWGIRGLALSPASIACLDQDCAPAGSYLTDFQGRSRRFFVDYNPQHISVNVISNRYIDSSVACTQYRVTDGEYGNLTYFTYDVDGRAVNESLFDTPGPSGLYVTSNMNSSCGERCTNTVLFQAQSNPDDFFSDIYISNAVRFSCNATVSNVEHLYGDIDPIYSIPSFISRMLAGMLGWSSNPPNGTIEYQVYQGTSSVGWPTVPAVEDVQGYLSQWIIAGVAAMDGNSGSAVSSGLPRLFVTNGAQPVQAQILSVQWRYAGAILGLIPFVHFWTLILVIFFANKVIIKDDNPIAVAKVYHTLLNKLGDDHGCMLTGDQLVDTLEESYGVTKIIYGVQEAGNGVKHVGIWEEGSGVKADRHFPEGDYDGIGAGDLSGTCQRRRPPPKDEQKKV